MSLYVHACMHMNVCIYAYIDRLMCMHICLHICMHTHVYVCRHKYACTQTCISIYSMYVWMCCKGVIFQTIKASVHAEGASLQTTETTTNKAFLYILFGKSDLQKMIVQFTPCISL